MSTKLSEIDTLTGDELFSLGSLDSCELIDGRIMPVSPTGAKHGIIEGYLIRCLGNFLEDKQTGCVLGGEVGIYIARNPDRIRAVDIAVISNKNASTLSEKYLEIAPDLIIEILSPNDRWQEIQKKIEDYFFIGTKVLWIVEPENKQVLIYNSISSFKKLAVDDTLQGVGILHGFSLTLSKLFANIR